MDTKLFLFTLRKSVCVCVFEDGGMSELLDPGRSRGGKALPSHQAFLPGAVDQPPRLPGSMASPALGNQEFCLVDPVPHVRKPVGWYVHLPPTITSRTPAPLSTTFSGTIRVQVYPPIQTNPIYGNLGLLNQTYLGDNYSTSLKDNRKSGGCVGSHL